MTERIIIELQRAAVALANTRSFSTAAEQLNISEVELITQIVELEKTLSIEVFNVNGQDIEVTYAGALFVDACRYFLATRNQDQK